ncbi:hypothetical protein [Alishewanella longhuensis]
MLHYQGKLKAAFVGDLLLPGGIGRTDMPGGDATVLQQSLQKLTQYLYPETLLFSSHDYAQRFVTTLAQAMRETPLLEPILAGNALETWQHTLNEQAQVLQQASSHLCGLVEVSVQDAIALVQPTALVELCSTTGSYCVRRARAIRTKCRCLNPLLTCSRRVALLFLK